MIKFFKKTVLTLFVLISLLTVIYKTERKMDNIRKVNKLTETSIVHNAPPIIAFTTVALGGFRGIIADMLWLRTIILQSQGKYFEMVQLASWINKLQPGFSGTSTFLAWNMAYNISITFANPKEKWQWVQNGIKILKEAIKDTPNKPALYSELSFIYLNKIGGVYDSSYLYYRNQIAKDMHNTIGNWTQNWKKIAAAPKNNKEIINILTSGHNTRTDLFSEFSIDQLKAYYYLHGKLPEEFTKNLSDNQNLNLLNTFLCRETLISKFYLDPEKILKLKKAFGNLDWNLYQAHSLYWLYFAPKEAFIDDPQFNSRIFVSINQALENGKLLLFNPTDENILFTGPNMEIVDSAQKTLFKILQKTKSDNFKQRYQSFVENAILQYFIQEKYSKAQYYLELLNKEYPNENKYLLDLRTFIKQKTLHKYWFNHQSSIVYEINKLIKLSFIYSLKNKKNEAEGFMNFAKFIHTTFNLNNDNKLPDFDKIKNKINIENIKKNLI